MGPHLTCSWIGCLSSKPKDGLWKRGSRFPPGQVVGTSPFAFPSLRWLRTSHQWQLNFYPDDMHANIPRNGLSMAMAVDLTYRKATHHWTCGDECMVPEAKEQGKHSLVGQPESRFQDIFLLPVKRKGHNEDGLNWSALLWQILCGMSCDREVEHACLLGRL